MEKKHKAKGKLTIHALKDYSKAISQEKDLYDRTPAAKSTINKVGMYGTEVLLYSIVPAGSGLRAYKLAAASGISSGIIGALQPVHAGSTSRATNTVTSAVVGATMVPAMGVLYQPAKKGMLSLYRSVVAKNTSSKTLINASSPAEIYHGYGELTKRQQMILDKLPNELSRMVVQKNFVKVSDLSSFTALTGDEFALFTRGSQRYIVRGNKYGVDLKTSELKGLASKGFKWSAHTHPGSKDILLDASGGDKYVLELFGQERSLILNSTGKKNIFSVTENIRISDEIDTVYRFKK